MLTTTLMLLVLIAQGPPPDPASAPAPPARRGESVRDVRLPRTFSAFRAPTASEAAVVRPVIDEYYKDDAQKPGGIKVLRLDLNGDRKAEYVVQPTGRVCGPQGCALFVLARATSGWRIVLYYDINRTRSFTVLRGAAGFRPISIKGQKFYWGGSDDGGSYSSPS